MGFKLRPGTSVFGNVTFTPGTNENYVAPPTHGSVNVALTATSTASTHIGDRPPSLAHDGIIGISDTDGSTISNLNAWVTTGEGVGAWMQLDWSTPQTVNKIKLYDRPNVTHDHIKGGTLTFSDGSSVTVGELPDGVVNGAPDPLEVTFDAKTITWVRFTVDAFTGHNAGLTEFEVWSVLAAPAPAPSIVTEGLTFHVDAGNISSYSGSGTTWTDLSGNGIDGTFVNGPTYSSDDGGKIVFDNSDDYINFTSPTLAFGTGPFAMEIWVKVTSAPDQFDQIMQGRNPDATGVFWGYRSGNLDFLDNNDSYPLLRKSWPTQGEWTHLVITRDASNIVSLYRNGVLDEGTVSNELSFDQTEMTIGSSFGYNVGREVGLARLYVNKGLNAEEVTQNYDDAKSRFGH